MKIGSFEFNLRELAGSLGDFGTLLPLAGSIASIFAAFPLAIVGAMMVLVGVEMVKFARDLRFNRHLVPVAATLAGSLLANMAVGFAAGMVTHYLLLGKEHRHADAQQ
jgi:MFS superfamily sulfate permease-like transporter